MGDASAPPLAAASSEDESASKGSDRSSASPASSDKTVLALLPTSAAILEPQLDRGSAIFSIGLGKRAPRRLQGPPYTPVLVRSDIVQGVAMAAGVWFQKYPQQYMCIFPRAGWQIDDLWDDEDIHLETESFCRELLKFIERDNVARAKEFAQDWSKMHPEQLNVVGGDMTDLYDKENPLSVVDKIFTNGEKEKFPPVFLWHVAHMMRTAMLTVKGVKLPAKDTVGISARSNIGADTPVVHSTLCKADGIMALPSAPSIRANSSTHIANPPISAPAAQPIPVHHEGRPSMRMSSSGPPPHGNRFVETQGHMITGIPVSQMVGPNFVQPGLHVPKNRPGRSASGSYSHSIPSGPHVENMPRGPSGSYPRQHVAHMSMTQSPRLNQAHMVTNHPMVNVPHGVPPFTYDQSPIASSMIAGQPLHHGTMHPNLMPHQQTQIQSPSVMHGYPRQLSGTQIPPYAAPMGDMTNMHYSPGIPPQNLDPRRPGDRRHSQQHGNGSALYDPYEGSNPAFISHSRAVGYSSGKKYNQNGFQNPTGRQRKASMPGSRPYHSQYTNDRSSHVQAGSYRFPGPKGHSEDDIAITQDHEHGCHINWIGPQNTTVNELFIKDLPEDIQDAELETLFQSKIGVKPKSVIVRSAVLAQHNYLGRKHAFVGFSTAAIARQAISIRDPAIRGLPVSITVPKRFFQKVVEVSMRDATEVCPSFNSRYTSVANNREGRNRVSSINEGSDATASTAATKVDLSYSPQDARSDLHKKKKGKQPQQGPTAAGSPEARKAKPKKRRESIVKEQLSESLQAAENQILQESVSSEKAISSGAVKTSLLVLDTEPKQSEGNKDAPYESEKEILPGPAIGAYALFGDNGLGTVNTGSSFPTNQQQEAAPQQVDLQPQQETQKVEPKIFRPNVESTKQSPIKKVKEFKEAVVERSPESFLENEDLASDDELKNDASFHSAAESQSDLEPKVQPSPASKTMNQGTITFSPKRTDETTTNVLIHTNPISSNETASDKCIMPVSTGIKQSNPLSTESIMPSADSTPLSTQAASMQGVSLFAANSAIAGTAKRGGVQHTESLHPFSKTSKAQAKKEREQKRKALKREKEQAEKAKAMKTSKSTAKSDPAETVESAIKSRTLAQGGVDGKSRVILVAGSPGKDETASKKEPSANSQEASEVGQTERKPASVVKPTEGAVEGRDKQGKRNGKKVGATVANIAVTTESKEDDYGKQTGGTTSNPNETGSMIKKGVKFDLPGDGLASDAQSSKREGAKDASVCAKESNSTVTVEAGSSKSAKKKKKKTKAPRMWPSLEFRPRSPNPPWMGPIDMETDTRNYDSIINEACDGEDDSDFSWDDLPRNASSEESKPSSLTDEEVGDGGEDKDEGEDANKPITTTETLTSNTTMEDKVYEHITTRETEQATTTLACMNDSVAKPETPNFNTVPMRPAFHRDGPDLEASMSTSENDAIRQQMSSVAAQMAEVDGQLAQVTDSQTRSESTTVDSQPAKKKRANKHNKRKKQQQQQQQQQHIKAAVETSATVDSAVNTEALDAKKTTLKATDDRIDNDDPFYDQLKGIEAIKRGDAGATTAQDSHSQHHTEISKSLADPQFMRTMEGYFKETQGTSQSKGRKVSKGDLL